MLHLSKLSILNMCTGLFGDSHICFLERVQTTTGITHMLLMEKRKKRESCLVTSVDFYHGSVAELQTCSGGIIQQGVIIKYLKEIICNVYLYIYVIR